MCSHAIIDIAGREWKRTILAPGCTGTDAATLLPAELRCPTDTRSLYSTMLAGSLCSTRAQLEYPACNSPLNVQTTMPRDADQLTRCKTLCSAGIPSPSG